MSIISPITHWWSTLIKHNPNTIKKIEVVISAEAPVVKAALMTVLEAYLVTKGIPVGSLPDMAAEAAMNFISDAINGEANAIVHQIQVTANTTTKA